MKTIIITILLLAGVASAQTNVTVLPVAPSPNAVKVAADVQQLVLDLFTMASGVSWSGLALTIYLAVKGVRNRAGIDPAGKLWTILSAINLEAPTKPLPPTNP